MKEERKILVVYNTCGVRSENIDYYINSIESILNQNFEGYKVVVSMFRNSFKCKKALAQKFGNKISYIFYDKEILSINQTFNKTVQICVKKFGDFEGYLYVDSGVIFGSYVGDNFNFKHNPNVLKSAYGAFKSGPYSMASLQVDLDAGYEQIGYEYQVIPGAPAQIREEDYIIPIGLAINLHAQIFSHELYDLYDSIIWPDVFAAYCSESTFSFLNSIICKKWIIIKDIIVHHRTSMEGPSSASASFSKISTVYNNPWNNLLHGRDAMNFINDLDAIEAGMGYEECNNIMMHKKEAFDENGYAKYPEKLKEIIKKYWFLSKEEFDYNKIVYNAVL